MPLWASCWRRAGFQSEVVARQKGRIPYASTSAGDDLADGLGRVASSPVPPGRHAVLPDRAAALACGRRMDVSPATLAKIRAAPGASSVILADAERWPFSMTQ